MGKRIAGAIDFRFHRQKFKAALRNRPTDLEIFTTPRGSTESLWPPMGHPDRDFEIIQLHWISKFIDYRSFFGSLPASQPVVWTLHDMSAMTGGCHFSDGCLFYRTGCGNCPQLERGGANDISRHGFLEKQAAIADANLHIVAPSRWLIESAQSSLLLQSAKSFTRIPYGIDADVYHPMDRIEARNRLGIAHDAKVVCFGAMDMNNRRKGGKQMLQAFAAVANMPKVTGLVFGAGELNAPGINLPPIHSVGMVKGVQQQRAVFSAADIYVLPSLEDNLPLTGLEAMACGTPILGFTAGGIPDYVRPGVSGMLAENGNADDLGQKLRLMLSDTQQCQQLGQTARQMIVDEYAATREAFDYMQLYAALADGDDVDRVAA
ncbi:glycosyltransferase [Stieleria marina]|uniref:glycosyltransferase n=1 Tax=Stieleria marina TaxID=1930275 RepID=UPI003AF34EA4